MSLIQTSRNVLRTTFNVRRALRFVWAASRGWTVANALLLVVQGLLPVASIYLLRLLVDAVVAAVAGLPAGGVASDAAPALPGSGLLPAVGAVQYNVFVVLLAAGAVMLLSGLARTVGGVVSREQGRRVMDYMHNVIHHKAVAVDLEFYENATYQDSLHRAQEEASFRPAIIVNALTGVAQNVISLAGVAWLLLAFSWPVLLVLVAATVPGMLVRLVFSRRQYQRERALTERERSASYYNYMLVGKEHAKEVRMFGLGQLFIERFQALRHQLRRVRLSIDSAAAFFSSLAHVASTVLVFSAYFWVARDAIAGRVSVGEFVMFYHAFQRGQGFLQSVLDGVSRLYENNLFLTNLYEFLDIPIRDGTSPAAAPAPSRAPMDGVPSNGQTRVAADTADGLAASPRFAGRSAAPAVRFEDVWFTYPGTERTVLKGVDLSIPAGGVTALVGLNGAGKTTLVKLLCRLYQVDQGRILLDGVDICTIDPQQLRRRIGVIFQDFARYQLSVRDNIWFGDVSREPDAQQLERAARQAGVHDAIASLSQGYDTILGRLFQNGHELSIGQWQKTALARAFFRDTEMVVLDEPTSAMDPRAEYELFAAFRDILNGRSALLISHRMSTVRMADHIYVMQDGVIVEHGPHAELMSAGGTYAELFEMQARSYRFERVG